MVGHEWPRGGRPNPGCRGTGFFFPTRCKHEFSKAAHIRRRDRATSPGAHQAPGEVVEAARVAPNLIGKWARHASQARVRRDRPLPLWHSTRIEDPVSTADNIRRILRRM